MKPELNILHVEDDPNDAKLISALLKEQGIVCKIERVETRGAYVDALARGNCDLILSDFSLPSFDGLAALALALEKRPDLPFVFMSGTLGEDAAIEGLRLGAADYILKDRPSRLGTAIRRAINDSEQHRTLRQAEKAMIESECKYRQLFEFLADAAMLADAETERVLDANMRAEALVGCSRGEILGRNLDRFLTPATLEQYRRKFEESGRGATRVTFNGEVLTSGGETIPVTASAAPIVIYDRQLILTLFRDRK